MTHASSLRRHLAESRRAESWTVHGNNGRALGAAVSFQRSQAESIFKRIGDSLGEFLRTYEHVFQAAKVFRRAAPDVSLQKRWCRDQQCDSIFCNQFTDGRCIQ